MKLIEVEEFKQKLENNTDVLIIDVRECWEYEERNIGAINYPLGELPQFLDQLPSDKTYEIIVHCESGRRSQQAAKYLKQQGFSNVCSLKGGLKSYF
ncbi:rhodanese-like domain-containing protein [Fulvivirga ligni]|uniref:rhodanese-like domain-containing protein n=1 Tax=Fulvivirga ligni TaxID=2904246 RepID=UPI001F1F4564|nr:rhodanese-like domain-containing protein [Fulvivirga ligni]UII23726.1 rhodanese-like domain-containing protein [Fulvivirga ligni]